MAGKSRKRVLVVGSDRVSTDEEVQQEVQQEVLQGITQAGHQLGSELAKRGYCILVGSDFEHDVDPHVVEGALEADANCRVEVHVPLGSPAAYPGRAEGVQTISHQFPDWDVTVMDTIEEVDGIIALGGQAGVVHTGLSGWKMGKPVIPIGTFGGGGRTMWNYGSATRQKFYRNALTDAEIDRLAGAWTEQSAAHAVDCLESVARRAAFSTSSMPVLFSTVAITLLASIGWVATLMVPYMEGFPALSAAGELANAPSEQVALAAAQNLARLRWYFVGFFSSIGLAGLLGAAMQTLRRVRDGRRLEAFRSLIDIVLGAAAGLVTAMLFLIAQVIVQGEVAFEWTTQDYSRVVLLSSMASLFASLYLDNALSRFDTVKESVMKGTYEG